MKKHRLSQLQRHILANLYLLSRQEREVRHWDLLFAVAQNYKFTGKHVEELPPEYATRRTIQYGKVSISEGSKTTRQYIDDAFQVSFSRSLHTLEERGFLRVKGVQKASRVVLWSKGEEVGASLIAKVLPPETAKLLDVMLVSVPLNKQVSASERVRREFEKLIPEAKIQESPGR